MPMASISQSNEVLLLEITVIIFSRNRPAELSRSIRYWSDLNVDCLVLDNSPNELTDIPSSPLISYLYCPNLNFSQRALIANEFIKNKGLNVSASASASASSNVLKEQVTHYLYCGRLDEFIDAASESSPVNETHDFNIIKPIDYASYKKMNVGDVL